MPQEQIGMPIELDKCQQSREGLSIVSRLSPLILARAHGGRARMQGKAVKRSAASQYRKHGKQIRHAGSAVAGAVTATMAATRPRQTGHWNDQVDEVIAAQLLQRQTCLQ